MDRTMSGGIEGQRIRLPKPTAGRGTSLFATLRKRRTDRSIGDRKLSLRMLANLLWSACGVNREKGPFGIPGRTAASASNSQEIDLYVALREGVYRYEPVPHCLTLVVAEDMRSMAIGKGQGNAGSNAPVRLTYVLDIDKFRTPDSKNQGSRTLRRRSPTISSTPGSSRRTSTCSRPRRAWQRGFTTATRVSSLRN